MQLAIDATMVEFPEHMSTTSQSLSGTGTD
jgi:hypothetical protein